MSVIKREVTIGDCRLILGDCLEVLPLLDPVAAVLTDPPYGIGIEIDEGYFDIACERIRKAYAQPDLFINPPAEPKQAEFGL